MHVATSSAFKENAHRALADAGLQRALARSGTSFIARRAAAFDAEIAELNQQWRQIAGPTDVLAFAAQDEGLEQAPAMPMPAWIDGDGEGEPLELGDIVISLDTAARQAGEHGHSLERELLFLASHGLLHLLGWDHPDEASLAAMLARQEQLLATTQAG